MADFENIVVEGTAEQLRNVLDASAYTDQKMNQYGIQKAGYISLQSQESDSDDDIIDIFPSPSVKDENGYPKYGIVEFSTSQDRTPTILRGIHDAINPDDATPLKQVEELLKNGNNTNQEAVLYTPQSPTPEQQAQARENIGAMAAGIQKSLAINSTGDTAADVVLETELRESGKAAMQFYSGGADVGAEHHTILGGLADGENDTDAATVRQVNEMIKNAASGTLSAEVIDNVLVVALPSGVMANIENGVLVVA